ncbi:MAG: ankyrin repeat domain-containing protein, partial [Planctomycetes bacterium]|nr:ankyrin repeat domain-containing protein [Planctomycetota bacterium]
RVSDKNNKTPLMYAAESIARDCVQLLLERGAQTKPHDANFRTALDYAAASNPNPEIVRDLARAGLKPNRCDYPGIPPLHWAAAANPNPEICAALLGLGADPLRRDAYGRRPLDWALAATIAEKEGMTDADRQKAEETLAAKIAILEQAEKAELRAKPWRRLAHLALWLPPRSRARRAIIKATANIGENTRFLMVFIVFSALYLLLVSTGLVTPPVFFVVFFSLCFLLRETA